MKTVSIRIDDELWSTCQQIARGRSLSFNKFAEEALESVAREARKAQVRSAFAQLAGSGDSAEYAFDLQAEVVNGDHN